MASSITTLHVLPGDNLISIALRLWGDGTMFVRLLEVNGLSDYIITAEQDIVIPPYDSTASGGIPSRSLTT